MKTFDIVILGGGQAGVSAALRAVTLGAKVCLIEKDQIGGTGMHTGFACLRSLINLPELIRTIYQPNTSDVSKLFAKVKETEWVLAQKQENSLKEKGVTLLRGTGVLVGKTHVRVESVEGGKTVEAKSIILAPGSYPTSPPTMPFDGLDIIPGDDILKFKNIPENVMVTGGSAAMYEIASLFNQLGSKVFLCTEEARPFPNEDKDIANSLEKTFKNKKIKLLFGKEPVSFFKNNGKIDITLKGGVKFSVSTIIWAGNNRKPNSEALGVIESRLYLGEQGEVLVNEKMETSLPGLYAIGGITGRVPSPALSDEEAKVAVGNALGKPRMLDRDKIPFIVYTEPELASVGCSADTAHYKGFRAVEGSYHADQLDESAAIENSMEFFKIVVDKPSKKVIGGHVLADRASEIIAPVLLAVKKGLTAADLAGLPQGTSSQGIREAALSAVRALKTDH